MTGVQTCALPIYKSQYEIAQQDFISGRKNYDQLVTPRFNMVKAIDEYENCRGSLKSLILQLELLTKVPIISLDELELNKNQTDTGK